MRYLVVIATVGGLLASIFNVVYLIAMLIAYEYWTDGAYHQPVLTALFVWGGATCAVLVLGLISGRLTRGRERWPRMVAVFVALATVGAGAGASLPFIHVNELTVAAEGFRQSRYVLTTAMSLRLYNAGPAPATLCHGRGSTCDAGGNSPSRLGFPGLTLRAGETMKIWFARAGDHPITLVDPPAGTGRVDTVVAVSAVPEDNNPPLYK
jgi:hypothetical protein